MRKITFLFVLQSCFLFSVSNVYSESEAEKWFNSGSSVISASKTSSGDDVRLQIEMSIPINTIVVWGVDQMIIGEMDGETFISPQKIEVNLKPRLRWDLTKILKSKQNQTRVRVVVEGAKGVVLNCRNNKWSRNRYLPMSTEKRTKISEWSERLETEYTWKRKNIDQDEFNSSLHSPFLSCIAEDKNGNLAFEHTF
ncbi:uncharacterized protein LOC134233595 isoform X2 [Saccostrea cucullata]|uniref:uncharacterized protein LOC134233595 isoform X2 n=1 Tax=Saccostrea cuccullata TaxID=36930 RepID=UPI002ED43940